MRWSRENINAQSIRCRWAAFCLIVQHLSFFPSLQQFWELSSWAIGFSSEPIFLINGYSSVPGKKVNAILLNVIKQNFPKAVKVARIWSKIFLSVQNHVHFREQKFWRSSRAHDLWSRDHGFKSRRVLVSFLFFSVSISEQHVLELVGATLLIFP